MNAALLIARALLVLVFVVAAVAKLAGRDALRRTLADFGLPGRLSAPGAIVLPLAELVVAGLLISATTARLGALAAIGLLAVFCAAIGRLIARGEQPDCNCFGKVHSAPVGWRTLARNAALAAVAAIVASRHAPAIGWVELVAGAVAVLVVGEAWLCVELLRRHGRALRRIDELETWVSAPVPVEVGTEAPPFVLPDLAGEPVAFDTLLADSSGVLLLFSDPGCGACDLVLAEAEAGDGIHVVVISAGDPQEVAVKALAYGLDTVLLDEQREVAQLYGVAAVPTVVLVDAGGWIAGKAAGGPEVSELMRSAGSSAAPVDAGAFALTSGRSV